MESYLQALNEVQRKAVCAIDGPVMVVAGPGSGKTRVLTFRIAHIINSGVPPWKILALTFTNKAAREMQDRIAKVVGDTAQQVWAGTFHSLFARILRMEADKIGYPPNFTIYDTDDSKNLIRTIIRELNLNKEKYNVNAVKNRISSAKTNIIPPKAYVADPQLMQEDKERRWPAFHKIYTEYTLRCKRAGAMDFDDLLFRLFELFHRNPDDVLDKYRARFDHVLVDEFQDTNYLQYAILKKLVKYPGSAENVCVVGDDAQSIYAFRGATIENILNFEKDFANLQTFKLEQNYRSTNHIVAAANEVIGYNRNQIPKKIWSHKGSGHQIKVIKAMADQEEGKRIIDSIVEQKNRHHIRNSEIAILYRTNAQSRIFEEYLRRYNVPYRVFGGLSFYQRKEVKDLIAYLRLAVNQMDEEALRRVINYPKRAIGKSTVDKVSLYASEQEVPMFTCLDTAPVGGRAQKALKSFKQMILDFAKQAQMADAYTAARYMAEHSGLLKLLREDTTIEGISRLDNLNALLDGIQQYVEGSFSPAGVDEKDHSLAAYIQSIALLTDQDDSDEASERVTLMSVHAAKGLEFKSIFLVGLEEKLFPSFMSMDTPEGLAEERRLFYVAITRAEEFLTLSYANSRYRFGKMTYSEPSRFLEEIDARHLDVPFSLATSNRTASNTSARSGVKGNFKPLGQARKTKVSVDPSNFSPSPHTEIQAGMRVLHLKFGEGKVLAIDGGKDNRIATIFFKELDEGQKRIMLKYAKLQILK